jgi:two-component system sensor kinase FixL
MTSLAAPNASVHSVEELLHHLEQLEARLDQVRQGLVRSHRLATLGTLTSIIAHEYNNILTVVISYCQLALARPQDAALAQKALTKALAGAEKAAKISSSILGFASGAEDAAVANLPRTVEEALGCLGRHPSKDGIELVVDVPDVAAAMAPVNLQQVILNLLLNARKVMKGNGGRLSVRAQVRGRRVRVRVSDTGPGIAPEIRDRLFEPFVTQEAGAGEELEERKGTGLGLFICRDLVESVGGAIGVESEAGRGATFWFELPLAGPVAD